MHFERQPLKTAALSYLTQCDFCGNCFFFFFFFQSEMCTAVLATATGGTSCRSFRGGRRTSRVIQNHNSVRMKNKTFYNIKNKIICTTAEAGLKSKETPALCQMEDIGFLKTLVYALAHFKVDYS